MKFFTRWLGAAETKKSRAYTTHITADFRATWSERDYLSFVKEAYQQNVVAFQAVNKLATAVSAIEWEAYVDDKEVPKHPLLQLLARPNPMQSGADWWKTRVSYLLISGNCYDERVNDTSKVAELWPLRPDRVKVKMGASGLPSSYEYGVGQAKVQFPADELTGESDILHTRLFSPLDRVYGQSPISAAAYAVDQHNATMGWIQALLQNSARPSGALVVDKDAALSDDEFARLKAEIEANHQGARNAGRPMLLEGGLDWKQMGFSPIDMEILRIKDSAARDISLAFGVPPLLLNIPGDNTYANYREARLGFYEDTVLPFVNFLAADLSAWMQVAFPGVELRPNKDKIEAIADKRTKLWEMADASDDLTLNESRGLKGYDPLPEPLGSQLMSEVRRPPAAAAPELDPAGKLKRLIHGNA